MKSLPRFSSILLMFLFFPIINITDYCSLKDHIPVENALGTTNYGSDIVNYKNNEILNVGSLIASTYIGGSDLDDAYEPTIVTDKSGNVYISGFTSSEDFPTTPGAYSTMFKQGARDRFISKFNNALSKLSASTFIGGRGMPGGFIGGNGDELGHAIAVDEDGNVYIAGYTESPDYPTTPGAYDETYNGGRDVFVSKFNADLTKLLASTFIGGTGDEGYQWPRIDMTISKNGDVYVTGITHSVDFPVSNSAYDRSFNGGLRGGDPFVVKLDKDLKTLKASTYLGGSGNEWRVSILLDKDDNVFVCGETESSDFPTTSGAYDNNTNPNDAGIVKDIFILKLNNDLSFLYASTVFGGTELDEALDMRLSSEGSVYISGYTESQDFPVSSDAYMKKWGGGRRDAYVAKFDNNLSRLYASTLIGGSEREMARGLFLDADNNVYITGDTESEDFPVVSGTYNMKANAVTSPRKDAFIAKFDPDLRNLLRSGCFGGGLGDIAFSLEADNKGNIFIAGLTSSEDFPTIPGSYDSSFNGGPADCFIVKFDADLSGN